MKRSLPFPFLFALACGSTDQSPADPNRPIGAPDNGLDTSTSEPVRVHNAEGDPCVVANGQNIAEAFENESEGAQRTTVSVEGSACARAFTLTTTQNLRDDFPRTRAIAESANGPWLHTGHRVFDALYALTREEVRESSVEQIHDGAFLNGASVPCGDGGCFETGRLWKYVWTRDTAYAADLGLALADPVRARNSLLFKLSERRDAPPLASVIGVSPDPGPTENPETGVAQVRGTEIVQDTGSGGSWPISSDRVAWALGARSVLDATSGSDRQLFAEHARTALFHTIERDRIVVFDPRTGLYGGETSFLDWREQTYPRSVADSTVALYESKSLSTNVLHYEAIRLLASLEEEDGNTAAASRHTLWADGLREAIRVKFGGGPMWASTTAAAFDGGRVPRSDALGTALAVLSNVANRDEARALLSAYPFGPHGPPVVTPQEASVPIYHNRAIWPFVTAYMLRAARHVEHAAAIDASLSSLVRLTALNLSNMENAEYATGTPWRADGANSGPIVNSQRQLWSVSAFIAAVHEGVFGLATAGGRVTVRPALPVSFWRRTFAGNESIALSGVQMQGARISVRIHLPAPARVIGDTGLLQVASVRVIFANGAREIGPEGVDLAEVGAWARFEVRLAAPASTEDLSLNRVDTTQADNVFAPSAPSALSVRSEASGLRVRFESSSDARASHVILRNGTVVAELAPGATSWLDSMPARSSCYSVEASRNALTSHRSRAVCYWPEGTITQVTGDALVGVGGKLVIHGSKRYREGWGEPSDTLTMRSFRANRTGEHLVQVSFANGGPTSTGITCAVKRVRVVRNADDSLAGFGYLVMPHLGAWDRWADSSLVSVNLEQGVDYRLVIDHDPNAGNMSHFSHFADYTGGLGGTGGPYEHVNISELRILAR